MEAAGGPRCGQRHEQLSLYIGVQSIGGIVAPWATGMLVDAADTKIEGYNTAFLVLGALMVVGGAVAAVLADPRRDDVPAIQSSIIAQ